MPSVVKNLFWFATGAILGIFFLISFTFIVFQYLYAKVVYPGVYVSNVHFGGKTQMDVKNYFAKKNESIEKTQFVFKKDDLTTTLSAKELKFGYNEDLLASQAYSIGRSPDVISNISLILQSYLYGLYLQPTYHFADETLETTLKPLKEKLHVEPIDALFTFENGKVSAFRLAENGQELDIEKVKDKLEKTTLSVVTAEKPKTIIIGIPIKVIKPKITSNKANTFGIEELIGTGTSLFQGSIPGRVHNVTLAATRINGLLVPPGETFSFNKAIGDISSFTGYQQAYVIQNGRTVLGDGGGVCQVSTTFFRALLNAGLPITQRQPHAYRVGYYEQDSPPGLDATIFVPTVDLQFKNDTDNHILIQTAIDPVYYRLTFNLYGRTDGRKVEITKPVILSQSPAPEPSYQDDPSLPKGEVKQVDFAAAGARVTFSRKVTRNGKVLIDEKFDSTYRPWQAVYLRGTKE